MQYGPFIEIHLKCKESIKHFMMATNWVTQDTRFFCGVYHALCTYMRSLHCHSRGGTQAGEVMT